MELTIRQLSKTYPNGVKALDTLDLTISKGMFGLLGPNGAGKSSLMRTIATLQQADSGTISFNGIDWSNGAMPIRKLLGYLPQEFGVYPRISAEKLLDYLALLKGINQKKERQAIIDRCLEITNLEAVRKNHVSSYSGGMKQRFGIAQLLLNNPQLIIVDEPTAGLDPAERQRFLNILREISTENIVIFSTHIVEDIKELCTDMAIMNKGRILQHETPESAIEKLSHQVWTTNIDRSQLPAQEANFNVLSATYNRDNSIKIKVWSASNPGEQFHVTPPGLEEVYFKALQSENALA